MRIALLGYAVLAFCVSAAQAAEAEGPGEPVTLFQDGFGEMRTASLGSVLGAEAEYHYLPEVGPKVNWWIATFAGPGLA